MNFDVLQADESLFDLAAFMDAALLSDMKALREEFAGEVLWEGDESQFVN